MDEEHVNIEPLFIPKSFDQLGILVLDGSSSMSEEGLNKITKAHHVAGAVKELATRLKISTQARNFSLAVVTFDTTARIHTDITPMADFIDTSNFDPQVNHGGGTEISAGLQQAKHLVDQFLRNNSSEVPKSVVVVIMSDGESQNAGEAIKIADELKRLPEVTIFSTFFSKKVESNESAMQLLTRLASDPLKFKTVYDKNTLRDFFVATVSVVEQKNAGER